MRVTDSQIAAGPFRAEFSTEVGQGVSLVLTGPLAARPSHAEHGTIYMPTDTQETYVYIREGIMPPDMPVIWREGVIWWDRATDDLYVSVA